ncbi:neprilysin-2-like isoform X2 [Stegodyphus dumicola]|nr:neprilysin-2-like isoform X2 [Stegodyphus dumicola]
MGNKKEKRLPGLKYTPNQLFWINAGNVLCEKQANISMKQGDINESQTPEFRVISSMSNLPEFARDFSCPVNTAMNRKNKCQIW